MRDMQLINERQCLRSKAESWMKSKLSRTGRKWRRQAQWGYRLFDFWCSQLGIAVEVDGPEHDKQWDRVRDRQNFKTSGILVLRVRNFNEADAKECLRQIEQSCSWNERRRELGLKDVIGGDMKRRKRGIQHITFK